ncbi:hypothetical protein ACJX0J_018334, partial [Zea mays]
QNTDRGNPFPFSKELDPICASLRDVSFIEKSPERIYEILRVIILRLLKFTLRDRSKFFLMMLWQSQTQTNHKRTNTILLYILTTNKLCLELFIKLFLKKQNLLFWFLREVEPFRS